MEEKKGLLSKLLRTLSHEDDEGVSERVAPALNSGARKKKSSTKNITPRSIFKLTDISTLLLLSEHRDGQIREAVVKRLGQLGDAEAIPALIARVNDELPNVCMGATQALLSLATPHNAHAFVISLPEIYSLKASKIVNNREFITRLERYLIAEENVNEIMLGYRSGDDLVSKACASLIAKYKLLEPAKFVRSNLKSGDVSSRINASHFLKDLQGDEKDAALKLAIKDESMPIRREAFLILLKAWGHETLAKKFLFDPHSELREIAIAHLKTIGEDVQYTYLRNLSYDQENSLCCCLWGLAYLNSTDCISQIKPFLKHSSEVVRKNAENAIRKLSNVDGKQVLSPWNAKDTYS